MMFFQAKFGRKRKITCCNAANDTALYYSQECGSPNMEFVTSAQSSVIGSAPGQSVVVGECFGLQL